VITFENRIYKRGKFVWIKTCALHHYCPI